MKRLVRMFAVGLIVVGTGVSMLPASAAVGTWTRITSPKGPGAALQPFLNITNGASPTTTLSGTTSADLVAGTDTIDIYCFSFSDHSVAGPLNAAPLAISPSHTFSGPVKLAQSIAPCVLRAVPSTYTGITGGNNTDYAGAFAGPKLYLGAWATTAPKMYGEAAISTQTRGLVEVSSADVDGVALTTPTDAFNGSYGPPLTSGSPGSGLLATLLGNLVPSGSPTRSEIVVDNHSAYLPYTLFTDHLATNDAAIPTIQFTKKRLSDGNIAVTETGPISWCQAGTYPPTAGSCDVTPTHVSLTRSYLTSAQGAVTALRDRFVSNDGQRHTVKVEYSNGFENQSNGESGVMLPGASSFTSPLPDTTKTNLPTGAHTIFLTSDIHAADGAPNRTDMGLTYSAKPTLYFANPNTFGLRYTRTVANHRPAALGFATEVGYSVSAVKSLAAAQQKALTPHLTLTAPASTTSDHTPTIRGNLTNAVNGVPTTVKVTIGTKSKTVAVSPTGTFAVTWTALAKGKHVVKATTTDPGGVKLSASRSFTID